MKSTIDQFDTLKIPSTPGNVTTGPMTGWGWLPVISLTTAIGIFMVAMAYNAARLAQPWANTLFWIGLLVIFIPVTARILSAKPSRGERITLLIALGVALYILNYLQYPLYFASYDELGHWRTASDIVATHHLFSVNPLLPISSSYPGMEIITSAISSLTGLPLFASGISMLTVTHVLFVLALYLFYERVSRSAQISGIATLLYIANAGYFSFDTSFSYESLALPIAIFVLSIVVLLYCTQIQRPKWLFIAILLGLGALVITHHVTTYALLVYLLLWAAISLLINRQQRDWVIPTAAGVIGLGLSIAWLAFTGFVTIGYLTPHLGDSLAQFEQILNGQGLPRQLFHDSSGDVTPLWQRILAFLSVALVGLGLPFGLFQIWHHHRRDAIMLALACGAIAYPVSQALRLTAAGGEAGYRSVEFLFLGIAFVIAVVISRFWLSRSPRWWRSTLIVIGLTVIFLGQLISGVGPPWALMPGPYLVAADQRSVEPEGITAAQWVGHYLGPNRRIASDRINTLLLATYGDESVVTSGNDVPVAPIFISLHFGPYVVTILQQDQIQYLVVDSRLTTGLPHVGTYFNISSAGEVTYTNPLDPAAITKFQNVKQLDRLFDSGNITVYDAQAISNGPPATSAAYTAITYPQLARLYNGTIYDIPSGLTTHMQFTNLQQQQGTITGRLVGMPIVTYSNEVPANGSLSGKIVNGRQIQFTLNSDTKHITYSFDGVMLSDGSISGSYCTPVGMAGKCSDYGLWSISPQI